ncbi:sensor histidine kinase [Crateriforma conspicua]|uniref:histidine kinase n=1 Tax=Crateriforma conspicua TaxID=2527996 RepID=A0A5C5Y360_9PLAN|nr:ATP-binding protein [Crateriforma conspicua]TWT69650.1 Sensor histidine kinase LiaS [Crateriforma conspicua]
MNDRTVPSVDLATATQIIEADRSELADQIHDDLIPLLFVARATIDRHDSDEMRQVSAWLADAMQTARAILNWSHTPDVNAANWRDELQRVIELLYPDDKRLQWRWGTDESATVISAERQIQLYRIIAEAVRNAVKHSSADSIIVADQLEADGYRVTVTDDGTGFDTGDLPPNHYGVRTMQRRADAAGMTLRIDSRPQRGTVLEVHVSWPTNRDAS